MDKKIALVAHDHKKSELIDWAITNKSLLQPASLVATGSTGRILTAKTGLDVQCLESGPLGGDQQLGAMIVDRDIDMLIFFWDPLEAQPHDPDVRALLRIAAVWNIPVACNIATADYLIHSTLFDSDYAPDLPNFDSYRNRKL